MTNIKPIDMLLLDGIFEMESGYVLNFSDRTFAQFFAGELGVDIDDPCYAANGGSKAKRLRCFLQTADRVIVVRALRALWEYREALRQRFNKPENIENAHVLFLRLVNRLEGSTGLNSQDESVHALALDRLKIAKIKADLVSITVLPPQARGYAFEEFLMRLFDAHGLAAQEPFRLRGEQIDGSFQFRNEIYLVEAKWQGKAIGVAELHTFQGKIEQKAAWTRGFFISNSGFTEEGLAAFGRGKRVICMDGYDLFEMLNRDIPFGQVLDRKIRRAAETGLPFVRVRDLFPQ